MVRFERHGGPPNLEAAFEAMVLNSLRGRSLDDDHRGESAKGRFPDFGAFRDLLLIEMKHLETEQKDRLNAVINERIDPSEMPIFYGSRDASSVLRQVSNREEIFAALASKLSRSLEGILRSANGQFKDYRARNPRKNFVNLCIILNSSLREFTPDFVAKSLHAKMRGDKNSIGDRFSHIDGIIYISEKHFRPLPDGRNALGMVIYEGSSTLSHPWKADMIDHVARSWSRFRTNSELNSQDEIISFETIEDIPENMPRHDAWRLAYKRNPYLSKLTIPELRVHFQRAVTFNALTFVIGQWAKPSPEETAEGLRRFQDLIEETNIRGIDMRDLSLGRLTEQERDRVFAGFPPELVSILMPPVA